MEDIKRKKISEEKNKFKKFILREHKFLIDLEWFVSDHMIATKKKIKARRKKLRDLYDKTS